MAPFLGVGSTAIEGLLLVDSILPYSEMRKVHLGQGMRAFRKIKDTEEERARARLLAHFEDNPNSVFYSRQLEVLFEREYFHWVTNRALRRLVDEGRVHTETRQLTAGSEMKLLWHRSYRFYKRAADEVFKLVDWYTAAATRSTRDAGRTSRARGLRPSEVFADR